MKQHVIISGSGRSGTTWVQDALAAANDMRTVFEPMHPVGVKQAAKFAYRQLEANEQEPQLEAFMDKVFDGSLRSLWANYRLRPDRFNPLVNSPITVYNHSLKALDHFKRYRGSANKQHAVVKFIRANLMLPWLAARYQFPTVLMVRHPGAVIASRMKLSSADWDAEKAIARYRSNERIKQLIKNRFAVDIDEKMSTVTCLCTVWCIENVLPLEWAQDSGYAVVSYEHLMVEPEAEWQRLVEYLQLEHVPDDALLGLPSQQVSSDMREQRFTAEHVHRWKQKMQAEALDEISATLERFGSNFYRVDDALPGVHPAMVGDR